jgi:hypothetical protein
MSLHIRHGWLLLVYGLLAAAPVRAQGLPQETVSLAGGRLTLGGEATATVAPDDQGRFNDTDYGRSALRLLRLGVTASFRPVERIAFVTELRAEGDTAGGAWDALPFAAYVRLRPFKDRAFDIQAGRIPPVFGVAGRRIYANDNVLVGYPLAWQYLTVLRADALPADANDLIYQRGSTYRPGDGYGAVASAYASGVPLVTAFRYDTGVEARVGDEQSTFSVAAAVTAGTLSRPGARDTNGGPQFSTRVAVRPRVGLILGASYADGRFLADRVADELPAGPTSRRYHQQTWGADAEYSSGHFLARTELVSARWRVPALGWPAIESPLVATAISVEGRYRVAPGVTVGARADHLGFSDLQGSYVRWPWDAPVTRVEGGVAWAVTRNVILRASLQHNARARGVRRATLPAAQVTVWF